MSDTDDFLSRYGNQTFHNSETLLPNLRSGSLTLQAAQPTEPSRQHYLRLYRLREKQLPNYPKLEDFRADIAALIVELEQTQDESIRLWTSATGPWEGDGHVLFVLFEAMVSGRILGCLRFPAEPAIRQPTTP